MPACLFLVFALVLSGVAIGLLLRSLRAELQKSVRYEKLFDTEMRQHKSTKRDLRELQDEHRALEIEQEALKKAHAEFEKYSQERSVKYSDLVEAVKRLPV
jgi:predicted  nucleic acid-binding Zn-ribbon protein